VDHWKRLFVGTGKISVTPLENLQCGSGAVRKGEATAGSFHSSVNNELLPSSNLPPNFPCSNGVKTATRWLHRLGYHPTSHKKVDGHESDDVTAHRKEYSAMMKIPHDTHLPPPLASDERAATPPSDAEISPDIP
jgi:hypothetical protein